MANFNRTNARQARIAAFCVVNPNCSLISEVVNSLPSLLDKVRISKTSAWLLVKFKIFSLIDYLAISSSARLSNIKPFCSTASVR